MYTVHLPKFIKQILIMQGNGLSIFRITSHDSELDEEMFNRLLIVINSFSERAFGFDTCEI